MQALLSRGHSHSHTHTHTHTHTHIPIGPHHVLRQHFKEYYPTLVLVGDFDRKWVVGAIKIDGAQPGEICGREGALAAM